MDNTDRTQSGQGQQGIAAWLDRQPSEVKVGLLVVAGLAVLVTGGVAACAISSGGVVLTAGATTLALGAGAAAALPPKA